MALSNQERNDGAGTGHYSESRTSFSHADDAQRAVVTLVFGPERHNFPAGVVANCFAIPHNAT